MEEILNYESRDELYRFLVEDFGLRKTEDKYDSNNFGNFHIILTAVDFSLRYSSDRSIFTVEISSNYENGYDKWYALSFLKNLIYNPENINADNQNNDNATKIEELNSFLQNDFDKISELFSKRNYPDTKRKLEEGLRKQFYLRFPSRKA
jgi:hypothetical protein